MSDDVLSHKGYPHTCHDWLLVGSTVLEGINRRYKWCIMENFRILSSFRGVIQVAGNLLRCNASKCNIIVDKSLTSVDARRL